MDPGQRHRCRDPQLARRPLPLPAGLHRLLSSQRPNVVASFTTTAAEYGLPASTLTDNGAVYTSRFTHGHNDFERLLASLGITQKNEHPGHPQTQGKIERFHQTLKRWQAARPLPATPDELQTLLDTFRTI
ncbi:integrase core domain-containing protein [Mycobacterium shottsii]|uniref:integrase core domain-containing protein n=1 Tax=Mycobacterium shottsii TaxID=133549 RepID=UPI00389915E0